MRGEEEGEEEGGEEEGEKGGKIEEEEGEKEMGEEKGGEEDRGGAPHSQLSQVSFPVAKNGAQRCLTHTLKYLSNEMMALGNCASSLTQIQSKL